MTIRKHFGVLRDLFLLNGRVDAGKHIYENAVTRQLRTARARKCLNAGRLREAISSRRSLRSVIHKFVQIPEMSKTTVLIVSSIVWYIMYHDKLYSLNCACQGSPDGFGKLGNASR